MRKKWKMTALFLCCICMVCGFLLRLMVYGGIVGRLPENPAESEAFRAMEVSPEAYRRIEEYARDKKRNAWEILAQELIVSGFVLTDAAEITDEWYRYREKLLLGYQREAYLEVQEICRALWSDVEYFPAAAMDGVGNPFHFEDTWMETRSYGGERRHEGCDIFGEQTARGYYPVISVTDGYVERVGWLPLGGYRIGIRSPGGGYFYYAHLSGYGAAFQEGDPVKAGQLLGFMGDSGYGAEGTTGKFPVHLHFGCYVRTQGNPEVSINPYSVLQVLEAHIKHYSSHG